jgi:hypothetical protein
MRLVELVELRRMLNPLKMVRRSSMERTFNRSHCGTTVLARGRTSGATPRPCIYRTEVTLTVTVHPI